jgi:hypothetical protein
MNAALPVEEAYRILTDDKQNGHLVLLDAKAAFDKCFEDLTNYKQNCYSSIVDGIVFASDVKRCTLSYFASVFFACNYMYSLGIQCKRQNIPDHAFYSYSVLNRSLSYIYQVKQWIGEVDNMEAKDWDGLLNTTTCAYQSDRVATRSR